jgi:streptogramin lyase
VVNPRDGAATATWPLYGRPTDLAADGDGAWAVTVDTDALTRVDARTGTITRALPLAITPAAVAVGEGAVWVADGSAGTLVRVVPGYDEMSEITFRRGRPPERAGPNSTAVAAGQGGVWVTDGSEHLVRVDPRTRERTVIDAEMPLNGVTVGAGAVWAISGRTGNVLRVDPATNRVTDPIAIAKPPGEDAPVPASIAASDGAVWVLNRNTATVVRIDPTGRGIAGTVEIGIDRVPNEIVAAGRTAWIANEDGSLSRIDEGAREARSVWVGESLRQAATNGTRLWVGTASLDQQLPGGVD